MKELKMCKRILLSLIAGIFTLVAGLGQTNHQVTVSNFKFEPYFMGILKGDTVTWTNVEGHHNVNGTQGTYPDNPESFGNEVGMGWTFSHVFQTTGLYDYQCDPHVSFNMFGQIRVDELVNLTLIFKEMGPHAGQDFWLAMFDGATGDELTRINRMAEDSFAVVIPGVRTGRPYIADFYADFNGNGHYDAPTDDHAWRINIESIVKDTTIEFTHNTNFTDIKWQHRVNVHFTGMSPHIGQDVRLSVTDHETGEELGRVKKVAQEEFTLGVSGIVTGRSYLMHFFADLNGNGHYDAPPADHAWQLSLNDAGGDTTIEFSHNTDFTDIHWQNKLSIHFSGMTPHIGQLFDLYLFDLGTETYVDTVEIDPLEEAAFEVVSYAIMPEGSYHIDFFADMNGNSSYDAPPDDHAWRMTLENVTGDTTLMFTHNTSFTDIFGTVEPEGLPDVQTGYTDLYPNPAYSTLTLKNTGGQEGTVRINIINTGGQILRTENLKQSGTDVILDISDLDPGLYLLEIQTGDRNTVTRFIKGN